jgi:hypothetical protein
VISTGDFEEALIALLGKDASGRIREDLCNDQPWY